jgi:hypothetical protein
VHRTSPPVSAKDRRRPGADRCGASDAVVNSIAAALKSGRAPRREALLLLCCASSIATPERTARLRALVDEGVDWQLAIDMASVQAVMPLVYRYLAAELEGALPPDAASSIRRCVTFISRANWSG